MKDLTFEEKINKCYLNYSKSIVNFARNYVKDVSIAEEIMQEVFVRLCEKKIDLNPESKAAKSYLFRMAKNLAIDYIRRTSSEEKKYNEVLFDEVKINEKFYMNTERAVLDGEIISTLYDTINSFPEIKREIFIRKCFFLKRNKEIINEMKISNFLLNKIVNEVKVLIKSNLSKYFIQN